MSFTKQQLLSLVNTFNRAYKIGDKVKVLKTSTSEETMIEEISSRATVFNSRKAVVYLKGKGCIDLTFVKGLHEASAKEGNEILTKEQEGQLIEVTDLLIYEFEQEKMQFGKTYNRLDQKAFDFELFNNSGLAAQLQVSVTTDSLDFI